MFCKHAAHTERHADRGSCLLYIMGNAVIQVVAAGVPAVHRDVHFVLYAPPSKANTGELHKSI